MPLDAFDAVSAGFNDGPGMARTPKNTLLPSPIQAPDGITFGPEVLTKDRIDALLRDRPDGDEGNKGFKDQVEAIEKAIEAGAFADFGDPIVADRFEMPMNGRARLIGLDSKRSYGMTLNVVRGVSPEAAFTIDDLMFYRPEPIVRPGIEHAPDPAGLPPKLSFHRLEGKHQLAIMNAAGLPPELWDRSRLAPWIRDAASRPSGLIFNGQTVAFDLSMFPVDGIGRVAVSYFAGRPLDTLVAIGAPTSRAYHTHARKNSMGHLLQARRASKAYSPVLPLIGRYDADDERVEFSINSLREIDRANPLTQRSILRIDNTVWWVQNGVSAAYHTLASRFSKSRADEIVQEMEFLASYGSDAGIHELRATKNRHRTVLALLKLLVTQEKIDAEVKRATGQKGDNKKLNKLTDAQQSHYLRAFIVAGNAWSANIALDEINIPAGPRFPQIEW